MNGNDGNLFARIMAALSVEQFDPTPRNISGLKSDDIAPLSNAARGQAGDGRKSQRLWGRIKHGRPH